MKAESDLSSNSNSNSNSMDGGGGGGGGGGELRNWSGLLEELLQPILKEIYINKRGDTTPQPTTTPTADCIRFGSVCPSWRSALVQNFHPNLLHPQQLPLLMIPSPPWPKSLPPEEKPEKETRSFYSLAEKMVISEKGKDLTIKLPYNRYCRGSGYGWIIATGDEDCAFSVELLNAFITINSEYLKIELPPLTMLPYDPLVDMFHKDYMQKAVLSDNPTTKKDYTVMAIYRNGQLCFWKPGNQEWTDIPIEGKVCIDDIIYHRRDEVFYMVNIHCEVMVFDGGILRKIAPSHPFPMKYVGTKCYLVESLADLLIVHRFPNVFINGFWVFKFLGDKKKGEKEVEVSVKDYHDVEWKVMQNLRSLPDRLLFVGDNTSMSLATSDFIGGKSGCIYFTDDDPSRRDAGFFDMGIYNMKDQTTERIDPLGYGMSPANTIWVAPPTLGCLRF